MVVIRKGRITKPLRVQVTCPKCTAILSYSNSEVQDNLVRDNKKEGFSWTCPFCKGEYISWFGNPSLKDKVKRRFSLWKRKFL